jgi:DUF2934 family protein
MAKQHHPTITSGAAGAAPARAVEPVTKPPKPVDPVASPPPAPEPEEIARLAYSYWQDRGCPEGSGEEDWLRAEADLMDQNR